jgi:hypothetical protein
MSEAPKSEEALKAPEHRVRIAIYLNELGRIDVPAATVEVDFYLRFRWKPTSDEKIKAEEDMKHAKVPVLEVMNRVNLEPVGDGTKDWYDDDHTEIVREQRYRGTIGCSMELHEFPFDTQVIHISIESTEYSKTNLLFEPWYDDKDNQDLLLDPVDNYPGVHFKPVEEKEKTCYDEKLKKHPELSIQHFYNSLRDHTYPYALTKLGGPDTFHQYVFSLVVERRAGYYLSKIGAVFAMCLVCSWTTFWMAPDDIGNRLGIFTTMFLTAVAFQYVVNEKLPNIPYLTKLDYLVTGCYTLLVLSGIEMVIIYQLFCLGFDEHFLFRADMLAFSLLSSPAVGLAIWFKVSQWRHEKDHDEKLSKVVAPNLIRLTKSPNVDAEQKSTNV